MAVIRVRTSTGWEELVGVQGPAGPRGPQGPSGANPTFVTTLPVTPSDGEEVYFLADSANGVVWHLRYRAASSDPSFKWEFVGGPPLWNEVGTQEGTSSTTYVDLATIGPRVFAPVSGYYIATYSARIVGPVGQDAHALASVSASSSPSDTNALFQQSAGGGTPVSHLQRSIIAYIAGGSALKMFYRKGTTGASASFALRRMELLPIKLG